MPDSFYTTVIMEDQRFSSPQRCADPMLLEPTMRAAVQSIMADATAMGNPLILFETFRSSARQECLYQAGATQLEKVGVHGYGLAADLVRDIGGEPSWKGDFSFLGPLAHKYGLVWGGDWTHFKDLVHVQRCSVPMQVELFAGTWYPDAAYVAYTGE